MSAAPKRRRVPTIVQLHAALRQLGLEPHECELDHDPALGRRNINADGTDWDPPQHDERYLVWRSKDEHRVKTSGTKATTAGSDIQVIAKAKRLLSENEAFRRTMLAKAGQADQPPQSKSKWPSRPFQKRTRG